MKSAREKMDMVAAYLEVGSYRGAAAICGTTPRTVKREVQRRVGQELRAHQVAAERRRNTDVVAEVVAAKVKSSRARISAKRLLPVARAEGYTGSDRNFRRLVAKAKRDWREVHHRGRRPGVWAAGETLIIDWGCEDTLHVFCAVAAWSRWRFVRFADNERADTTFQMLAACFETLGGVPQVVLADRMACLRGAIVADVVIPTAAYVRFASHYGCRPDFCQGADPESKGMVERLVGYAKSDLVVPQAPFGDLSAANEAAAVWCDEVNGRVHSEISAVPAERMVTERELFGPLPSLRPTIGRSELRKVDRLSCVRFASARYSVPLALVGKTVEVQVADGRLRVVHLGVEMAAHQLVAPGETSIIDDHYGGPRPASPRRAVRPRSAAEQAICALGDIGETFIKGAAAAGATSLGGEIGAICALETAYGRAALVAALERAVAFGRWRLADIRSILDAGAGIAQPAEPGQPLTADLPAVPVRPLSAYRIGGQR